jgi:hypothetical protein
LASVRVKVNCVFGTPEVWRNLVQDQFQDAIDDWASWRSRPDNASNIENFGKRFGGGVSIDSPGALINALEMGFKEALKSTYHDAAKVENVPTPIRTHVWVADAREAVFVMAAVAPKYVAHAFWTRDSRLISAFLNMHQEYLDMSQRRKVQPGQPAQPSNP